MENLEMNAGKDTPYILLDDKNNKIHIEGKSFPENAFQFYAPVMQWIHQKVSFLEKDETLTIFFKYVYFNTSSSKIILDILDIMEENRQEGKQIAVEWHYSRDNDVMEECGEEFQEDFDLHIQLIEDE